MRQAGRGGAGPTRDGPEGDHRPGGEHAQEAERGGGPKGVAHVARFQGGSEAAGALEQEPRQALRRLLALLLLPASEARVAAWLRVSALLLAPLSLVSAGSVERGRRERERGQERVMVQDGTCPENARDVLRVQARLLLCRRRRQRRACRARLHLWGVVCHVSCVRVGASQFPKQSWRHRDTHIRRHGQTAQDCGTGLHDRTAWPRAPRRLLPCLRPADPMPGGTHARSTLHRLAGACPMLSMASVGPGAQGQ